MTKRLQGRHLLVVGGASGIGLACAETFLREGAMVAIIDQDRNRLVILKENMQSPMLSIHCADVTMPDEIVTAVDAAADDMKSIDGVVNAAGIHLSLPLEMMPVEDWARVMSVNLTGPMLVCRAALRHLRAAVRSTIVNVSSAAGLLPLENQTAYCASKGGLQMFSKSLALEGARYGIRVNTVCPGAVETAMLRNSVASVGEPEKSYAEIEKRYAQKRIAKAAEIADAVLWLTSDESTYVTGTAIAVDGGRTFH